MIDRRLVYKATDNFEQYVPRLQTEAKLLKRIFGFNAAKVGEEIELERGSVPVYFTAKVGNPFKSHKCIRYGLWLRHLIESSGEVQIMDFPTIKYFTDILCGGNYPDVAKWRDIIGQNEPLNYTKSSLIKVGRAMKVFRKLNEMTLEQVARDLDTSVWSIRKVESGQVSPSTAAGVLGIRYILMYGTVFVDEAAKDFDDKTLDYDEDEFFDLYDYICKLLCF